MAQVIEVRLLSEVDGSHLTDMFTQASSHEEAVRLALNAWSGGRSVMKGMHKAEGVEQGKWDRRGPCFTYQYQVDLEGKDKNDGSTFDWGVVAVLFAQYKEEK